MKKSLSLFFSAILMLGFCSACGKEEKIAEPVPETNLAAETTAGAVEETAARTADDAEKMLKSVRCSDLLGLKISELQVKPHHDTEMKNGTEQFYYYYSQDAIPCVFSTPGDSAEDTIGRVYLLGYDREIVNGIMTGKTYEDYKEVFPDLSEIAYDASSFAYTGQTTYSNDGYNLIVTLFFNAPDGRCTGAVLSTDAVCGECDEEQVPENPFAASFVGLPAEELLDCYGELLEKGLIGLDVYSSERSANVIFGSGGYIDRTIGRDNTVQYRFTNAAGGKITVNGTTPVASVLAAKNEKRDEIQSVELLPGIKIGDTYRQIRQSGYDIESPVFDSTEGRNISGFSVRVGAALFKGYFYYDSGNRITEAALICPLLTNG